MTTMDDERAKELISGLNLAPKALQDTLKNQKMTKQLVSIIEAHGLQTGTTKEVGALVVLLAATLPVSSGQHRDLLMEHILAGKLATNDQVAAAVKHVKARTDGNVDRAALEKAAGVGVVITDADVAGAVSEVMAANKAAICEERYRFNLNKLIQPVKAVGDMVWADIGKVKAELDVQAAAMLGPKTAEDEKPAEKPKKTKAPKATAAKPAGGDGGGAAGEDEAWRSRDPYQFLPPPQDNTGVHTEVTFSDGTVRAFCNTQEQLQAHLKATGGEVVTRFPPEPNGYLHVGHAKAMFVDFGMAAKRGGRCYLRFDDTNPEAESMEYIDHIKEIVKWMGWTWCAVTHSSDYFEQLHAFAVRLIHDGKAYVCHQSGEEIKAAREAGRTSPWRDRLVDENLRLFEDMRRGLYDEGAATLRLRMDPGNTNRNMDDIVAYRIKFVRHPHVGAAWCIYPSYDFTHCIVDSLEQVTHSLCTLEFDSRRASYYWLLDALGLYMPVVWEYSRLNLTNNVMSKRKIQVLVTDGYIRGWDDPRLPTLAGMRRRGMSPEGINSLCQELGITRSDINIPLHKVYHHIRAHLEETSPRALGVLRPLKLVITNLAEDHVEQVQAAVFPGRGGPTYGVPFSRVCYIERTDFQEQDSKDYYGLAPGKTVMLRYAYKVTYEKHMTDSSGRVSEVHVTYDPETAGKPPKGVLSWVACPAPGKHPTRAEVRLYADALFKSENPADAEDWLKDLNKDSEEVLRDAMVVAKLADAAPLQRFQLERLGYFCVDSDSKPGALVLNRTCTLRDTFVRKPKGKA